jgi:hypothetical protein
MGPWAGHQFQETLEFLGLHVREKYVARTARHEIDDCAEPDGEVRMPLEILVAKDHQALYAGTNYEVT